MAYLNSIPLYLIAVVFAFVIRSPNQNSYREPCDGNE